jgi:hypothetical protein
VYHEIREAPVIVPIAQSGVQVVGDDDVVRWVLGKELR